MWWFKVPLARSIAAQAVAKDQEYQKAIAADLPGHGLGCKFPHACIAVYGVAARVVKRSQEAVAALGGADTFGRIEEESAAMKTPRDADETFSHSSAHTSYDGKSGIIEIQFAISEQGLRATAIVRQTVSRQGGEETIGPAPACPK